MISEEHARGKILEKIQPLPSREVPPAAALDQHAALDYVARLPLPVFDNSAMDGYAVLSRDCRPGARLRVVGEQPAGQDRQLRISSGETVRIFTGAPIPAGADAVVMQEDVEPDGDEISLKVGAGPGEFVRKRGCDLSEGQKILGRGERIRATTLALLVSQGFDQLTVGGDVNVAIISTGDELARIGEPLRSGQIYESNSILLQALLGRCGATLRSSEHCRDEPKELSATIERGTSADVLIITGGVSVGERDLVKPVLTSLGASIDIWRVAIKPGKPFLFGQLGQCIVFGLPGNPVSAFITFLQFVRPAILKMMGATELELPSVPGTLMADVNNDSDRAHYIRGRFDHGTFVLVGRQESHALFGLSQSNALLRLAPGEKIERGATVELKLFD